MSERLTIRKVRAAFTLRYEGWRTHAEIAASAGTARRHVNG